MQDQGEPTVGSPPSLGRPEQDAGGDRPSQAHSNSPVGRKNLLLPEASQRSHVFVDLLRVDAAGLQKQLWWPPLSARRIPEAVALLGPRSSSAPDNLPAHPALDTQITPSAGKDATSPQCLPGKTCVIPRQNA